jgi:hypothetical protein
LIDRDPWQARVLPRDEFGLWLGALAGDRNYHTMSRLQLFPRAPGGWREHLNHVYAKLDVDGRADLAGEVARRNL